MKQNGLKVRPRQSLIGQTDKNNLFCQKCTVPSYPKNNRNIVRIFLIFLYLNNILIF